MGLPPEERALAGLLSAAGEPFDEYAERILEAGRAQLVEFGMRRTSLDDVARAAGVGRATLFRRFPNRDALMLALAAREAKRGIARVDEQLSGIDDPQEFLVAGALAVIRELTSNELLQRLLVTDANDMLGLLTGQGSPILAMGRDYMAGHLRRIAEQGGRVPGDPEVIAEILARVVMSLAVNPDSVLPLRDDAAMERVVRTTVVPMVLRSETPRQPAPSAPGRRRRAPAG